MTKNAKTHPYRKTVDTVICFNLVLRGLYIKTDSLLRILEPVVYCLFSRINSLIPVGNYPASFIANQKRFTLC